MQASAELLSEAGAAPVRPSSAAREVLARVTADMLQQRPTSQPPSASRKPPRNTVQDFDETVDRFIEYDLGRLRGRAGQAANRRFKNLGPDAIPALVRGLNKAAGIQASCPIGVISRKLQSVVSRTSDQAFIDYAIQNIGRDVPRNAPQAD